MSTSAGGSTGPAHQRSRQRGLRLSTRQIVIAGLLGAITAIMGAVPYLGLIPLPFSPAGHATIMHIPVILAAILEGPVVGALVGFIFGLFSFMQATLPFFKDPIIAFVPRVLIGIVAYYVYVAVKRPTARGVVAVVVGLAVARTVFEAGLHWLSEGLSPEAWGGIIYPLVSNPPLWTLVSLVLGAAFAFGSWRVLRGENASPAVAAIAGTLTNTVLVLGLIVLRYKVFTPEMAFFVGLTHGLPELIVAVVLVVMLYRGIKAALRRA